MPCPHNEITIVQRSQRQSAVAAAAYQSGEKLFCEYDQQVKHYPEKRGIVHNEILLPANAPRSYADRNTLWNAAEAVEKQWNSQLARRWVLTIPREIPSDQYAVLVREFCQQQFVSKGMIVDFAIHDPHPPGHNPHAPVLLTMRAMDEHGKWLPKSRKVYDLDENGERIKLPSGRWKSHKEDTVDWNDQKYCEIWRHEWEVIQNRYLEANDRPERVDLRSYARQGLDIVPTSLDGKQLVTFEELYDLSNPDEPKKVTEHKDIEDKGQTITFKEKPEEPEKPETPPTPEKPNRPSDSPKTGDNTNLYGLLMRLSNGFVIDKEKTFGELKFTAVRDVFLQNEDGTPSTQLKKRIYDLKCSLHGGIIPVSVPPEVPLREFPYNAVVELVNPVADTVSRKTYTGADVDWYVKAEDIVLKNKGNQNAGSPQNPTPQGQPKK